KTARPDYSGSAGQDGEPRRWWSSGLLLSQRHRQPKKAVTFDPIKCGYALLPTTNFLSLSRLAPSAIFPRRPDGGENANGLRQTVFGGQSDTPLPWRSLSPCR